MSIGVGFKKTINDLTVSAFAESTWLTIQAKHGATTDQIILRSTDEVRDLKFAIDRYLAVLEAKP